MVPDEKAFAYLFLHGHLLAERGFQARLAGVAANLLASPLQPAGESGRAQGPLTAERHRSLTSGNDLDSFDWGALEGTSLGSPEGVKGDAVTVGNRWLQGDWANLPGDGAPALAAPRAPVSDATPGAMCSRAPLEASDDAESLEPPGMDELASQLQQAYLELPELTERMAVCRSRIPDAELVFLLDAVGPLAQEITERTNADGLAAWLARYLADDAQLGALVARIRIADPPTFG